ncbi:MAG: hypothetical protein AB1422_14765 [bacterium]
MRRARGRLGETGDYAILKDNNPFIGGKYKNCNTFVNELLAGVFSQKGIRWYDSPRVTFLHFITISPYWEGYLAWPTIWLMELSQYYWLEYKFKKLRDFIGLFLKCTPPNGKEEEKEVVQSIDPNDKASPTGFDPEGTPQTQCKRFIPADVPLSYMVFFENLPTATAYAQEIKISDQLSPNLDTSTLIFNNICIGGMVIDLPEDTQQISTSTIFYPGTWSGGTPETDTVRLNIQASLSATETLQFRLEGRDLSTNELSDLLPPNSNPPNGEGWVSFSIKPKNNLPSGTQIKNKASIVFDINPPLDTPEVFNTIDSGIPTSSMNPLPATITSKSFNLCWAGSDDLNGSGIRNYTIYCSDNESPYAPIYVATSTGSYTYRGKYNHRYRFYSRASDNVGNLEAIPETPDCEILLIPAGL